MSQMRDPSVPVQTPPFEIIFFHHLSWTTKKGSKGLVAYLPVELLEKIRIGLGQTCNCQFIIHRTRDFNTRKDKPQKISDRTVFSEITFWCQFGPEDHRGSAKVRKLEANQRRGKLDAGESIKVGCRAHFSAKVYYNEQNVVEINILKVSWVGPDFSFAVINTFKLYTGQETA